MAGLYLHIPFCKQACYYCDFHFSTQLSAREKMIKALQQELILQKDYLEREVINTIYFGGGTPSLLSREELEILMDTIQTDFRSAPKEVTLEANPDDLLAEKLLQLKESGVNRLSIGIQSFDDRILKFLNRAHSASEALACFDRARTAGFGNLSVDLIYAIPGQDNSALKKIIGQVIGLSPEHISAYSLTIEKDTVFGNWLRKGKLQPEKDEVAAEQMEMLIDLLGNAGYEHYEISNFCKSGFRSRHNSGYWRQKKYLGIGPSAHSFNGDSRQSNVKNNALYIQSIEKGFVPFTKEILSRADKINEYLLTTLRTSWGCEIRYLLDEHGYDLLNENEKVLRPLFKNGLVEINNHFLLLTPKGKMLADKIASDLFISE